jgi:hypothetical protein
LLLKEAATLAYFSMTLLSKSYLIVAVISALLSGCTLRDSNEDTTLIESLLVSTNIVNSYTKQELKELEGKRWHAGTSDRAKAWFIVANKIDSLTTEANSSLAAYCKNVNDENFQECKAKLSKKANDYVKSILSYNQELRKYFENDFTKLLNSAYFKDFTSIELIKVNQVKACHSISIIANKAISYCNQQPNLGCVLHFDKISVLMGQNSIHFKTGDKLEITAGVGAFSIAAQPKIVIGKQLVPLNNNGYAEYKKLITADSGKHILPVKISYYSQDGELKTLEKEIEYFVDK